ncbi:hypothetical protein BGX34_008553 [Mortierella sp. NVP85]|nr:hypothetical protein BGX34_008553 [Mortierella sp. NVP85]
MSSGAIHPPEQRSQDHTADTTATLKADASFLSVGSVDSIIPNATAKAVAQEGAVMANAAMTNAALSSPVSTALINTPKPAADDSGKGASQGSGARAGAGAETEAGAETGAGISSVASPPSTQRGDRQQSSSSGGRGYTRSHPPKKYRAKEDKAKDNPRPSAVVTRAPATAMHWSRAKVHGQIPPKELRAQSVSLVGESVYVFGGCDQYNCFNTLYIFDADTMYWSQPKTSGSIPPPCRAHTSTLVGYRRLYIFGGGDGPQYFNDLYVLDTETLIWSSPTTTGNRPCKRRAHTTCYYNNRIYVFGGGDGLQALNDTFELDLATMHWSEIKTTGQIPLSRGYHTSNIFKSQMIVFGGSDGHECFSDVHVLDLDTMEWIKIDINKTVPRLSHTSTLVGSYLFVLGGHDGSRYTSDVEMLNMVTWSWETRKVYGVPPAGRGYHASLLYDSRLFMFGGYDGQTVYDDIYILDLSMCAYLPQITDFQIVLRRAESTSDVGEGDDYF